MKPRYGKIRGVQVENCNIYNGVPFAKPPIGELRWKAPQTLAQWDGILEADHFQAKAIQGDQSEGVYGKEMILWWR